MSKTLLSFAALAAAALAIGLSGCGGGSTTYDGFAIRACLDAAGVQTNLMKQKHMPGSFAAVFPTGELALFYVGSDSTAVKEGRDWLIAGTKAGGVDFSGEFLLDGNLLVMTNSHPTVGMVKTIDDCKSTSAKT